MTRPDQTRDIAFVIRLVRPSCPNSTFGCFWCLRPFPHFNILKISIIIWFPSDLVTLPALTCLVIQFSRGVEYNNKFIPPQKKCGGLRTEKGWKFLHWWWSKSGRVFRWADPFYYYSVVYILIDPFLSAISTTCEYTQNTYQSLLSYNLIEIIIIIILINGWEKVWESVTWPKRYFYHTPKYLKITSRSVGWSPLV